MKNHRLRRFDEDKMNCLIFLTVINFIIGMISTLSQNPLYGIYFQLCSMMFLYMEMDKDFL